MRLFDKNFQEHKLNYVFQAIAAGITCGLALLLFDVVDQPMIVASFGASVFIIFVRPHAPRSDARHLIGGYLVGISIGVFFHYLTYLSIGHEILERINYVLAGGGAVAVALFVMALTNTEHAPAASIALGFVINNWKLTTISNVIIGIVVIVIVHTLLKRRMVDLL